MNEHLINPITRKPFRMKIGSFLHINHEINVRDHVFFSQGFHSGTAIGGLIGDQNLQYCLFGDTVTIVSLNCVDIYVRMFFLICK